MDNDTSTPSPEDTYSPPQNNVYDLFLQLRLASSVKIDSEPFEKIIPTWQNNIVMSEFWRMMISYVNKHPEHREILSDIFRDFIKAYLNEKDNHSNPFVDYEKQLKWEGLHLKLLAAKTIDESYSIVGEAAKDGFGFRKEYFAALSITKKLQEMEKKGLLEHAIEELVFVCYINKNISLSRDLEQNEQESKIKFLVRAEKRYKKLESFMEYLHQIEDNWHKRKERISKKKAIEEVFNENLENTKFIELFEQNFNLNIKDEHDADVAKRKLERMVDNYTNLWYEVNDGVSRNGHKRQRRRPHPDYVKKRIGESRKKAYALKNKDKIGNRPSKSGNRGRKKKL